jgi:molybdopterin molybdotransferase
MVTVAEAFKIIQSTLINPTIGEVDLSTSIGAVLAEPIHADRDLPPFNRVAMDGIAIHSDIFKGKGQDFIIDGVQAAGAVPLILNNLAHCIEVMTGSVLPVNTDVVIRYEDLKISEGKATVLIEKLNSGMNIHSQANDAKKGEPLLKPNQRISPAEISLLASVGKKSVRVFEFPKVAVISSGDELVEIEENPLPHQIRKSNIYALQAAMFEIGWRSTSFHLTDDQTIIKKSLQTILVNNDVLILSGGVSKGKFDFIPEALEEVGIKKFFHGVSQRPGKPFWFGASADQRKIVFALPGNPVSTFLCFHKYIKPWIMLSLGVSTAPKSAKLVSDVKFNPSLTYFLQVKTEMKDGVLLAHPIAGGGSGDFVSLKDVDGFLELPLEKSDFKAGEVYPFISFRQ